MQFLVQLLEFYIFFFHIEEQYQCHCSASKVRYLSKILDYVYVDVDQSPWNQDGSNLRQTLKKRTLRMGTWNIQEIRNKKKEVFGELKLRQMDICVLTETKMKVRGNEEIGDYIHLYSGVRKDLRAKRGVSIALHKNLKKSMNRWKRSMSKS
ncbi:hypothetical protein HHI36_002426 [Cryptolaemus montrouzieri]|uniref:Uncharacterized protein n=1 Tax=Cryptolaemus montrouzieri TaxID=559131 RepID=A0ABD2PAS5_9CUCU